MSESVGRKLDWLVAAARDRRVTRLSLAAAVLLSCRYLNRDTGTAWPSERTLGEDLGTTGANVHLAVTKLVDAGWLVKEPGGPRRSNRYSIPPGAWPELGLCSHGRECSALMGESTGALSSDSRTRNREPGSKRTPQGPRRRRRGADPVPGSRREPVRAMEFPRDWKCGDAEVALAGEHAKWVAERAHDEFKKFRRWHRTRATRSIDWAQSWASWCRKGAEIEARDGARRSDKVSSAGTGARSWLDRQRAAAGYGRGGGDE